MVKSHEIFTLVSSLVVNLRPRHFLTPRLPIATTCRRRMAFSSRPVDRAAASMTVDLSGRHDNAMATVMELICRGGDHMNGRV